MTDRVLEDKRRNSFDAVRMFAAFCVLVGHQFDLASYTLPGYAQPALGPLGLKLSDAGLYIFFALSGYLVFQSLDSDPRIGRFLGARILRIYPGAVANTLLCVLFGALDTVLSPAAFWGDRQTWLYLAHNLPILAVPTQFQLPGVLADARWPAVNVPIWTLKYELASYLALLVLYRAARQLKVPLRLALAITALAATAAFLYSRIAPLPGAPGLDSLGPFYLVHTVRFFMVFFAGALYAALEPLSERTRLLLLLGPGGLVTFGPSPEFGRAGILLLLALMAIELGKSPLLYSATYRRIGDLSYGTYLYAFPIQLLSVTRWLNERNFWAVLALDIGLILGCAMLSWHGIERPALRWKRGRRDPEPIRPAPTAAPLSAASP